jgi:sarcosine oxidase / L-pipecolate oxidase
VGGGGGVPGARRVAGRGVLNATKAVAMIQALAVKKGAMIRDNTEVVDIRNGEKGGVVVRTSAGEEFRGAKCVVTVGAWTSELVRSVAGLDIPIRPLHATVLCWRAKPGRERDLTAGVGGFPTFSCYGDPQVYGTPSLELPGLVMVNYDGRPPCDPDDRNWANGGSDVAERVARWIEEFMPDHVDAAGGPVERQACMYSMTPDKDFVGGEFVDDVVVGAGFSGHGFKMGPAVGASWPRWRSTARRGLQRRQAWSLDTFQDQPVPRQPHGKGQGLLTCWTWHHPACYLSDSFLYAL